MKRSMPFGDQVDISSDESSPSDTEDNRSTVKKQKKDVRIIRSTQDISPEDALLKRAAMYQEYMKRIPLPKHRGAVIPFTSWTGLARSMKQLYQQPLHYLTNIRIKQWDQLRDDEEDSPLDALMHPCKAETSIWLIEEVHRLTSSHQVLAKLWLSDPMYHTNIDSILPQL